MSNSSSLLRYMGQVTFSSKSHWASHCLICFVLMRSAIKSQFDKRPVLPCSCAMENNYFNLRVLIMHKLELRHLVCCLERYYNCAIITWTHAPITTNQFSPKHASDLFYYTLFYESSSCYSICMTSVVDYLPFQQCTISIW